MEDKLKKVKNIYYAETKEEKDLIGGEYCTGLVIELEDGRMFRAQSSDVLMSFEQIEPLERISEETPMCKHGMYFDQYGNRVECPLCLQDENSPLWKETERKIINIALHSEPLQNGEREEREKISEILVKYNMPTRQVAINEIIQLLFQSKKEEIERLIELAERYSKDVSPRCAFLMCDEKSYGYAWKDIIDNLERELESLTNQKKEDEK